MTNTGWFSKAAVIGVMAVASALTLSANTVTVNFTAQQIANAYNQTYSFSGSKQTGTGFLGTYNSAFNNSTLETGFFGNGGTAGAAPNPMNSASAAAIILDFYLVPDNTLAPITWSAATQTTSLGSSTFTTGGVFQTPGTMTTGATTYQSGQWARFQDANPTVSPFAGITTFSLPSNLTTGGTTWSAVPLTSTFSVTFTTSSFLNTGDTVRFLAYTYGHTFTQTAGTWSGPSDPSKYTTFGAVALNGVVATPEPSTVLLMGAGVGLIALAMRRRAVR